jgi:hypothetical protein
VTAFGAWGEKKMTGTSVKDYSETKEPSMSELSVPEDSTSLVEPAKTKLDVV